MSMKRFTRKPGMKVVLGGVLLGVCACSLQDFEYLQEGAAGASAAGGNGGASGSSSGSGGSSFAGSSSGSSGSNGGKSEPSAGTSGDSGEAGSGGAPSEGGAPAGGNAGSAPVAGGGGNAGTLVGDGGDAGEPTGAGGDPGSGGTAGTGGTGGTDTGGTGGTDTGGTSGTAGTGGQPPLDGNLLQNPGFEFGLTGWTVDPATAVGSRHVYTQAPNPANGSSSSLATWHQTQEYSLAIFQTLTGLEPGTYTFKGSLSTQATQEAYLFARNCGGEELTVVIPPVSYEWFEMSIPSFTVSTTSCEVGLFVHGVADVDWLNADMFSFEKDP
jgi:hypothetical protein